MTQNEATRIDLQLAPSAHVTEAMRASVLQAMTEEGLAVSGWLPLEGEAKPEDWPTRRIAQPSLYLVLTSPEPGGSDRELEARRTAIGGALGRVRQQLPALPIGVKTISPTRKRWWGFRPDNTPADIQSGMGAIVTAIAEATDALGWDREAAAWVPM